MLHFFIFQLEPVPSTVILQAHDTNVVAADVHATVLPALVSPYMLNVTLYLFINKHNSTPIVNYFLSLTRQSDVSCRLLLSAPPSAAALGSIQPVRACDPPTSGQSAREPGGAAERTGRRGPEWRGAELGLAGLGLHSFTCCRPAHHSLLLLLLQPLPHGHDGHVGALPVSLNLSAFSFFLVKRTFLNCCVSVFRHQAGWFPFNLENELLLPGANQDEMEAEQQNQDLQEMVSAAVLSIMDFTLYLQWQNLFVGRSLLHVSYMSLSPAGRTNGRQLRRWRWERRGRSWRSKQQPKRRLPGVYMVIHRNLLHVTDPRGPSERR